MKYFNLESENPKSVSRNILTIAVIVASLVVLGTLLYRGSFKIDSFADSYSASKYCDRVMTSYTVKEALGLDSSTVMTFKKCVYVGPSEPLRTISEIRGISTLERNKSWELHDFKVYGLNGNDYKVTIGFYRRYGVNFTQEGNWTELYSIEALK